LTAAARQAGAETLAVAEVRTVSVRPWRARFC